MTALNTLDGPDGSATYCSAGYTIIAACNGPIEVSRRDEHPEEATLEINVRPAIGVGSPRDRYLELLLHSTLSKIIAMDTFPRSLIQVTLQVLNTPTEPLLPIGQFATSVLVSMVPALLNAAQLALLSGAVPLRTTFSVLTALHIRGAGMREGKLVILPLHDAALPQLDAQKMRQVSAVHVFAITGNREVVLAESEGDFSFEEWEAACTAARGAAPEADAADGAMDVDGQTQTGNVPSIPDGRKWMLDLTRKRDQFVTS